MNQVAYIIDRNEGNITIYIGSKPYTIYKDHINYETILDCLRSKDYEDLECLLDIPSSVAMASDGKIMIDNEKFYYNGVEIHNIITERILDFMKEGFPFESLILFLENLLKNPVESAINELYLFLESGKLPITDDGCFLAYKKVDDNFLSYHPCPDGTYLEHPIGGIVEMKREDVDVNRDCVCSRGLHFCSLSYLPVYSGGMGKVIILKINPKDVCAIPRDYKNTKGRAWRYEVMAEYDYDKCEYKDAFNDSYVDTSKGTEGVREVMTHIKKHNLRDKKGRFIKKDSIKNSSYGTTPNGKRFHNVRGKDGKFKKLQ